MRILYIGRTELGAMGEAAASKYASIASRHHDVLVLAPRNPKSPEKIVVADSAVRVEDIYSPDALVQIDNVFQHIRDFGPDIIHMIQSPLCFHYPFYLRHLAPNSKWIIDFRSPYVGGKRDKALKRYFVLQFYVDCILTHSMPSLRTNIRQRLRRAYEIPPGVDLALYEAREWESEIIYPRSFVYVGSINESRKLEFLVRAFGNFSRNNPQTTLDIYGDGNAAEKLAKYTDENNLRHCISLCGVFPQEKLLKKMATYDAGIAYVPYEHFSLAPSLKSLEYSAAGIPVLASDTDGHRLYNKEHDFKFRLFHNSVEDFCSVLDDVVRNGCRRKDILNNIQVVKQFDWNHIVESRLLPLYSRLLA